MARLYILTPEQAASGKRPNTPREKQKFWSKMCLVLSILIVVENLALLYIKFK